MWSSRLATGEQVTLVYNYFLCLRPPTRHHTCRAPASQVPPQKIFGHVCLAPCPVLEMVVAMVVMAVLERIAIVDVDLLDRCVLNAQTGTSANGLVMAVVQSARNPPTTRPPSLLGCYFVRAARR